MKKIIIILFLLVLGAFTAVHAQYFAPKWVVLEPHNTVGIVKPGANDLLTYMSGMMKNMDRDAFKQINAGISFTPGCVVLVYDKVGDLYLGGDVEGRTLLLKGELTYAEQKEGAGPAYVKEPLNSASITIPQGVYVWIKKRNPAKGTFLIQYSDKENIEFPADKFFVINETTAELAPSVEFKEVK